MEPVPTAALCCAPVAAWFTLPVTGRPRRIVPLILAALALVLFGWSHWSRPQRADSTVIRVYVD